MAWASIVKACKRASILFQKFVSKWISKDTATGIVMHCHTQRIHDHCPRCDALQETHPEVRTLTDNLLVELEVWLTQEDTSLFTNIYPSSKHLLMANGSVWGQTCLPVAHYAY